MSVNYRPTQVQGQVIAATHPVVLVTGGAGTGKTTTAAAAVRDALAHLADVEPADRSGREQPRALFLSFSRAAVAQILDRTAVLLGSCQDQVEITTYHAFAWNLVRRFGSAVGLPDPVLASESEVKLLGSDGAVRYRDLVPLALRLCQIPAIAQHVRSRWSMIVCDEFQDTDYGQYRLVMAIRGQARLLLLADPNQCIYSTLPDAVGVGPERLAVARSLPGAREIPLPDVSYRDPSGVLPAAAAAVRNRDFAHESVATALADGRLEIRSGLNPADEAAIVSALVRDLRRQGHTVGVFSHHIDSTMVLSDKLLHLGVDHEIVGPPESVTAALDAQHVMVAFAGGDTTWDTVRRRLAVFITSMERGSRAPDLARMMLGELPVPQALAARLKGLRGELASSSSVVDAAGIASHAHKALGFARGGRQWNRAARLLRPLVARSARHSASTNTALGLLERAVSRQRAGMLTYEAEADAVPVQLMGLYQTKGREADATVVVLRSNDFYGKELAPFPAGSRLLYVVLTRARHKTIVLLFGNEPPGLIAPLAGLAALHPQRSVTPFNGP